MGQSPGAPCKLTPEQEHELAQVIATKRPVDVGFPAKHNWTSQLKKWRLPNTRPNPYTYYNTISYLKRRGNTWVALVVEKRLLE
ncbi:hypothetical protein P4S83_16065 [Aneurinibacillus thermoaerophilus]|uniref:hypothetical protein n=1 Tax=Aneurinibacillus thermoaerophilus TaxID=143495 RepID=UPI002E1A589E|nr:hypothetical protein [Aneurinibacillus thermoaerophilus]MED0765263.1 hypothetical protein [Aneurinibacillus thermoaerophilus]